MKVLLSLLLVVSLASCRPDQEETDFNEMDISALNDEGPSLECSAVEDLNSCIEAPLCQPVYNAQGPGEYNFEYCDAYQPEPPVEEEQVPEDSGDVSEVEDPETPGAPPTEEPPVYNPEEDDDDEDSISDEQLLEEYGCRNGNGSNNPKKISICHIPPGNYENAHTICISINGWKNGHKDRHQGGVDEAQDYLGTCKRSDVEGEELTEDDLVDD